MLDELDVFQLPFTWNPHKFQTNHNYCTLVKDLSMVWPHNNWLNIYELHYVG